MDFMMKHNQKDDLKKMYELFKRVPECIDIMANQFQPYAYGIGKEIVKSEENKKDPNLLSSKVLELKSELDMLIEYSFAKDPKFQNALNSAFHKFQNEFP